SLGPVAVHEHRVLLDGAAELGERLQLPGRRRVVAESVLHQSEQLAHARGVGQRVAQRSDEAQGVALVVARVGVGRLHQLVVVAGASGAAETDDLVADVAASISSSSPLPSAVSRTAVAPVSAPPARMTSLAIVAPGHHGSVSTRTPADATSAPAHASSV